MSVFEKHRDTLERHESSCALHQFMPIARRRSHTDGQAAAMEVEAGNIVHDGLGHDVNWERDVGNRSLERCERRLRQKQRTGIEWTRQQSRDDEPSLGDEETSSNEQAGVGNISEVRQPLVGVRFDADDCHGAIVLRSTRCPPFGQLVSFEQTRAIRWRWGEMRFSRDRMLLRVVEVLCRRDGALLCACRR